MVWGLGVASKANPEYRNEPRSPFCLLPCLALARFHLTLPWPCVRMHTVRNRDAALHACGHARGVQTRDRTHARTHARTHTRTQLQAPRNDNFFADPAHARAAAATLLLLSCLPTISTAHTRTHYQRCAGNGCLCELLLQVALELTVEVYRLEAREHRRHACCGAAITEGVSVLWCSAPRGECRRRRPRQRAGASPPAPSVCLQRAAA